MAIACPELVFAEMGAAMSRPVQLLLGYELCGGYSRDDVDPREGKVTYSVDPLTTPETIGAYLEGCRHMPRIWQAREVLPYLLGNAWSPIEDYLRTVREADKAFRLFESNGPKLGTWLYIPLNEQTGRFT